MSTNELVKVRFRKSHSRYAYNAGDNGFVKQADLKELLNAGFIILFPGVDDSADSENTLPVDMPCRDLLFSNGFDTVEKVTAAGDTVTDISGIGPKSLAEIKAYLNQ